MSEALPDVVNQDPVMYPSELDVIRAIADNTKAIFLAQTHDYIETKIAEMEAEVRADINEGRILYDNPEKAIELQKKWRRESLLQCGSQLAVDRALVQRLRKREGLDDI